MQIHINNEDFRPEVSIVLDYFFNPVRPPFSGQGMKAEAARKAYKQGYKKGVADGLGKLLTGLRGQRYPKIDRIPTVTEYDVEKYVLTPAQEAYDVSYNTGTIYGETHEQRETKLERFVLDVIKLVDELIIHENLEMAEVERHREAVLAGTEDARESDQQWLKDLADEAEAKAVQLRSLVVGP